ncbi:MAG: JAB domain-containing protein [Williamsia sp.]|nr:JAB domain-containing protein [Williamsia sp.]
MDDISSQFAVTEVELVYRNKRRPEDRPKLADSLSAYGLLLQAWDMNRIELVEQFKIMLLDRGHSCLGISDISSGGISACIVDPKIIFATVLKARATSVILAHNHPSGSLQPSQADIDLTKKLKDGSALLDVSVLDHLIVTPFSYYSFADEGLHF